MMGRTLFHIIAVSGFAAIPLMASEAPAAPTVAQALKLTPLQDGVDFDQPTPEEVEKCTLKSQDTAGGSGWIVFDESGRILRRFLDSNGDNKIDLWCYYKAGIEVYRDVDSDFNERADQYRWLATAGTRWGIDRDEDGKIDRWKRISAEEVTEEIVAAIREQDPDRFWQLLPTDEELKSMGLGAKQREDLTQRTAAARAGFTSLSQSQEVVGPHTHWLQFGASRPGILPEGTDGLTKDLVIYDHVAAIVETDGKHGQLNVGSLVLVGEAWRAIDLPKSKAGDSFFYAALRKEQETRTVAGESVSEELQGFLAELERIDKALVSPTVSDRGKLHGDRAELLEKLIEQSAAKDDRTNWLRQYADTVSAAVQAGEYPDGLDRLKTALDRLLADKADGDLVAYVRFQYMTAEYGQQLQQPNADFTKVQEKWLKDLEEFVKTYAESDQTAEAMLQLAIALEFAGKEAEAVRWYSRIVGEFSNSPLAAKAAGAKRRLECVGKSIQLQGKTLAGAPLELARFRGRVVLVHYWATWCEPCKRDMENLKALQAKFARRGFSVVGVNLDSDAGTPSDYVRTQRLGWPQLYESGGLDSRLANEMGILTLPTMLLIDKTGRVVRRNIHVGELETEIAKLLQ
ncbi:MAG: redoxin family protein [Pirellulaceae bacterium]